MNQYEQFLWDQTGHKYLVRVKKMLLSPYGCAWSYWSRNIILDSGYDTPDTPLQAWQACLLYNAGLAQDREFNFAEILMGIMIITVALQLSSSVFLSMQTVNTIFSWLIVANMILQFWLRKRAERRADQFALNHWDLADDYNHWKITPTVKSIFKKSNIL